MHSGWTYMFLWKEGVRVEKARRAERGWPENKTTAIGSGRGPKVNDRILYIDDHEMMSTAYECPAGVRRVRGPSNLRQGRFEIHARAPRQFRESPEPVANPLLSLVIGPSKAAQWTKFSHNIGVIEHAQSLRANGTDAFRPLIVSTMKRLYNEPSSKDKSENAETDRVALKVRQRLHSVYPNGLELSVMTILKRRLMNLHRRFGPQVPQLTLICNEITEASLETIVDFQNKSVASLTCSPESSSYPQVEAADDSNNSMDPFNSLSVPGLINLAIADLKRSAAKEAGATGHNAARPSAVAVLKRHIDGVHRLFSADLSHFVAEEIAKACVEVAVDFQLRKAGIPTQPPPRHIPPRQSQPKVPKLKLNSRRPLKPRSNELPTVYEAGSSDDSVHDH
ncbi:hypothetical protein SISNIDRAFT_471257 [Sistotremastrum niveocremeum HHB9708]|uniref:Uncharacterized protein n=1 Tax=Sistotremastrum niveocremeum HHB9708 TaxID=1314777 RepID=A0A164MVS0_9AGAM|nr:hypothetical protein SISNIDRAFT_471257 [Sistotremastrum niveocremeum HHB9708]